MKILHYALGFPPYRTGGLTKYCTDLMQTQKEQGHCVALLWPGRIRLRGKKTEIRRTESWKDIISFELINPLPVALDEGIQDIEAFTQPIASAPYQKFLKDFAPEVIHIHTLMGLHRECLEAAKEQGIRTVFTSHDYFGLCPKVTLFHDGKPCDEVQCFQDCVNCNDTALDLKKIILMQSPLYRALKNTRLVQVLRLRHRRAFFERQAAVSEHIQEKMPSGTQDYHKLRSYYISMLENVGMIHFNSSVTEEIYRRYFEPRAGRVISITHRDISDHRKIKDFNHEKLRLTYLGPAKPFKGFYVLINALDELWNQGITNFELHIYSATSEQRRYITERQDGYSYDCLEDIFEKTDLLAVPSLWYETYGYTVLEALSYGVPVLASKHVGAKDLLEEGTYGCVAALEQNGLCTELKKLCQDRTVLLNYNRAVKERLDLLTMEQHSKEILSLYEGETGDEKRE